MAIKLNPPILENTLPAFTPTLLKIPFSLNRSVSSSDFNKVQVLIKTVSTNEEKFNEAIIPIELTSSRYEIIYDLSANTDWIPQIGQYYKVQIAFVTSENIIGYFSNTAVIKCISTPVIYIKDRENTTRNTHEYIGVYQQKGENSDKSEKVYSYCFNLYDESQNKIATSGVQLHNSNLDVEPDESCDIWVLEKKLEPNLVYTLGYSVTTINGFESTEFTCAIIESETVDSNIHADLSVINNFDDGYNEIILIGDQTNTFVSGEFILLRTSSEDNYDSWYELCRFPLLQWDAHQTVRICKDYTIKQGHYYKYAIQAYNSEGFYSNRRLNIEGPVLCDFEDCFLYDGDRQLKIRFNPKVSSFKSTVLETKVDTIGGKYPFIFRNGNVEYKEFPISGLLSLAADETGEFSQNSKEYFIQDYRSKTPSESSLFPINFSELSADNYKREREFKLEALKWLNNGQPKLFRSPSEGNFIVRLMNVSLSPNDTLGRLLHTFNSTAYEIAEYSYSNLKKYKFTVDEYIETRQLQIRTIDLNNPPPYLLNQNGDINLPSAKLATISARQNIDFTYILEGDSNPNAGNTNLTGTFVFPEEVLESNGLISIHLDDEEWGTEASLTYGYYNEPDRNFSYIKNINVKDVVIQQPGLGIDQNLIDLYTDIRTKTGAFHYIGVKKKFIQTIYYSASEQCYRFDQTSKVTTWVNSCLYRLADQPYYIDGANPPYKNSAGQYNSPNASKSILIDIDSENLFGFQLNNSSIIDFDGNDTTDGRYEALTGISSVEQLSAGRGVILDLVYQEKEILYSVEEENVKIIEAKQNWQNKLEEYQSQREQGKTEDQLKTLKNQVDSLYITYTDLLIYYLTQMKGDYVIEYAI